MVNRIFWGKVLRQYVQRFVWIAENGPTTEACSIQSPRLERVKQPLKILTGPGSLEVLASECNVPTHKPWVYILSIVLKCEIRIRMYGWVGGLRGVEMTALQAPSSVETAEKMQSSQPDTSGNSMCIQVFNTLYSSYSVFFLVFADPGVCEVKCFPGYLFSATK